MGTYLSWKKIKAHFFVMVFSLLFLIIFPVTLLLCLPIYLFRFIVAKLIKLFRRDLDKMITTRSAVIAIDDPSRKPNWNLCVWFTLEGNLDFDHFRDNFNKTIVKKQDCDGNFVRPEFQQFYHKCLGFLFWKWEENFDINEHMRYYFPFNKNQESKITTEVELKDIVKNLTAKPFNAEKSPWEFLFIPNFIENGESFPKKSILIFRVHHGFCDGYTILWLLINEINKVSLDKVARPVSVRRSVFSKLINGCIFWIRIPYEFVGMMMSSRDKNDWHLPMDKLEKPFNTSFTPRIPLEYIKNIKRLNNVAFTSIIMASLTGGLRNMMLETGVYIPEYITTAVAVPMPDHPNKLRNHFIFSFMKLPVGTSDSLERLAKIEQSFQKFKRSPVTLFTFAMIPLFGGLFTWMINLFSCNTFSTVLTSNFPGPPDPVQFIGGGGNNLITDINFTAGMGLGSVGIGFCMVSYNEGMRIITSVDKSILPTDLAVDRLNEKILEELKKLQITNLVN